MRDTPIANLQRRYRKTGRLSASMAAAILAAAAAVTCREATAPGFALDVAVTGVQGPEYANDSGLRVVACTVALMARATGTGLAAWRDAEFYLYLPNRTTPMDSADVPAALIDSAWGNTAIAADSVEQSRWELSATVPFSGALRYHYRVFDGAADSSQVTFDCTFGVPPGPAPTITQLGSDSPSDLEPGKVITLDLGVSSTVGLWQTTLQLAGPCDTSAVQFEDSLEHAVTRKVRFLIPASCDPGESLVASGAALDADLQSSARSITLSPLVDGTPPTVSAVEAPVCSRTPYTTEMYPTCFIGDTLQFMLTASDNYALGYLVWDFQPAGYRDSVAVEGRSAGVTVEIPLTASLVGTNHIRMYARDAAGNVSAPIPDSVQIFPTVTAPTTVAAIPATIYDVAIDTLRNLVYLLESDQDRIAVFSPATGMIVDSIALGDAAHSFDLSPSGDSIVTSFASSRSLAVIDLRLSPPTLTVIPLALDSATTPWYVRVTSAGSAFLLDIAVSSGHVYTYDLHTGILRRRYDAGNSGETSGGPVERSYDRSVLVINSQITERYDAASDAFGPPQPAGWPGTLPAIDGNAGRVAIGTVIYDSALHQLASTYWAVSALSPDGQTGYGIAEQGLGVVRTRASDGTIVDKVETPILPNSIRASPDGKTLVITGSLPATGKSGVAVVDLTQTAPAIRSPRAVARVTPQPKPLRPARPASSPPRILSHASRATARPTVENQPRSRVPWSFRPMNRAPVGTASAAH